MKFCLIVLAAAGAFWVAPATAQEKLQEIVVIASRTPTPLRQVGASVSVVDRAEIQLRGSPSVADLLRTEPGLSVSNTGGPGKQTSLRVRGEEGYRTLILIDGIKMSDPTGTQVMPQVEHLANGSEIERIEILRGPQGFIYGADAGGVINITTLEPTAGLQGSAGVEGGRYGSQKFNGFISGGNATARGFISVADWATDGFNTWARDIGGDADGYTNTTWHGKFTWDIAESLTGQVVVRDLQASSLYDTCFGSNDCLSEFAQTATRLSLKHSGERFTQQVALVETDVERDYFTAGQSVFATRGDLRKLEYLAELRASDIFDLVLGQDRETERVVVENGTDLERDQVGLFGEGRWHFDDRWFFTGGARYDDNEDFGEHLSARVTAAHVRPVSDRAEMKLRLSGGSGFRAPSLQEIAYNQNYGFGAAATTLLTEEKSQGFDVGVDYFRESGLAVQLTFFAQQVADEIVFDLADFSGYLQADGRSHSRGCELEVEVPINQFIRLEANFTRNLTEAADDLPPLRRPGKLINLALHLYPQTDWSLLLNSRWVRDAYDIGSGTRVAADEFAVFDISTRYQVVEQWELFARVENALDENYQEVNNYNTAGRSFFLGTRFTF